MHSIEDARGQIQKLVDNTINLFRDNLRGVYLHGSLAMGCYNPACSDIDLLILTHQGLSLEDKKAMAECILQLHNNPCRFEFSILHTGQFNPWRHPAPFDFHFSGDWKKKVHHQLESGEWRRWNDREELDEDLAGHFTIARERGERVWGEPVASTLPDVPREDYKASILADLHWSRERAGQIPVYGILNHCRVCAFMEEGLILSKAEGGDWAISRFPPRWRSLIVMAVSAYLESAPARFDDSEVLGFMDYVHSRKSFENRN